MAFELTVGGYTFENPPESYRKRIELGNSEQQAQNRTSSSFYQSDSQEITLEVEGTLALNPALGGTDDTNELEKLQDLAIRGGEVEVEFDPFFSGMAVIEDDPFEQEGGESSYKFTFTINSESTDASAYPAHSAPDTGNTFEFGDLNLGFDPNKVTQNYKRNTQQTKRLQGIARSVDTKGLVPEVRVTGIIDGDGQAQLWDKARSNVLAYLNAEFQNGWALIDRLSIQNLQDTPDYLNGMFRYDMQAMVVMDPSSGIGEVSKFVDRQVQDLDEYVSNCDDDGLFERLGYDAEGYPDSLDYRVTEGTGSLQGDYVQWDEHFGTLDQNATNYLFVEDSDGDGYGQVNRNTSGFPATSVPLWEVDTTSDSVTDIRDRRSCLMGERLDTEETGDINLSSGMRVKDSIDFERLLRISDSLAIADPTLPWLGLATLDPETLGMADGPLDFRSIISMDPETLAVLDGGSASEGGGSTSTETLTWGTASDWDAAVSESGVVHESFLDLPGADTVQLGYPSYDETGQNSLLSYYPMSDSGNGITEVSGNWPDGSEGGSPTYDVTGPFGQTAIDFDDANPDYFTISQPSDLPVNDDSHTIVAWVYFDAYNRAQFTWWGAENDNEARGFRSMDNDTDGNEDDLKGYFWGNDHDQTAGWNTGTWVMVSWRYDGSTSYLDLNGTNQGTYSAGAVNTAGSDVGIGARISSLTADDLMDGRIGHVRIYNRALSESELSDLYLTSGSITTATKSFASSVKPDLQNLQYSLNGESIDLDVIGSPGTASEEVITVTLDGSTSYSLNWNDSHSDFRIRPNLSTSAITGTPEFSQAELVADVFSGGDADQNPNTTWEIQGATHDTSGNEYEGGGVVSRYGAD